VQIGHIYLDGSMNGNAEHFIRLVESLARLGVRQHVVVRNQMLAKRLAVSDNVSVGPTASAAVTACCLMPSVAVVHTHDETGGHAGLLLMLARSVPYVATRRSALPLGRNPIIRSVYGRAASLICPSERAAAAIRGAGLGVPVDVIPNIPGAGRGDDDAMARQVVGEYLRIYRRAAETCRVPALLL